VIAFALYAVSADGLDVTPAFVTGRLASFALIGIGLGFAGRRLRESERTSRRLVEGLPLVMYIESEGGLRSRVKQICYTLFRQALPKENVEMATNLCRMGLVSKGGSACRFAPGRKERRRSPDAGSP
jgi:hypothetical protein